MLKRHTNHFPTFTFSEKKNFKFYFLKICGNWGITHLRLWVPLRRVAPELRLPPDLHVGGVGRGLELAAEVCRVRERKKDNSQSDEEKSVEMALSRLDKWEKGGGGGGTPSLSPHSPHCAAGVQSGRKTHSNPHHSLFPFSFFPSSPPASLHCHS